MTDKDKLEKLKKLADGMYYAAQYLTTDASRLRKTMEDYRQFIIQEYKEEPVSEDLEEAVNTYIGYPPEVDECSSVYGKRQAFKAGAEWQKAKDESMSDDLGEYINELSKQFPEVSFAKLTRIAVHVAKWMMKDAVEETVDIDSNGLACVNVNNDDIMIGDTVKVLIKKGGKL